MMEFKAKPIIILLIVIMIVIITVGATLYAVTDMFKSSEQLFKKYVVQNLESIASIIDISKEEEVFDIIQNNNYSDKFAVKLSYLENENDQEEVYTLLENGTQNNSEEKTYKNINIAYNGQTLSNIELLKEKETYGFRLADLVQQFVSLKNENITYFVSSMGYNGQYFPEVLKKVDISGLFKFSDEELQTLANTYIKTIFSDISSKSYSSKGNVGITLNNGEYITTNAHILTLNQNDLDKIYKRILTQMANDNIIISKINELDEKIKEVGINLPESETISARYKTKFQEMANAIEYEGTDSRQVKFTVYQAKGITVRTLFETETESITLDIDRTNGNTITIKETKLNGDGTDTTIYSIGYTHKDGVDTRTALYEDAIQKIDVTVDTTKSENKIEMKTNLDYNNDKINALNIETQAEFDLTGDTTINTSFEEDKNIILNDYEPDEVIKTMNSLKEIFVSKLEENQGKINTKLLNNILVWIDKMEKAKEEQKQNEIELQKQRFNNQFVLYVGEDLELEHVQKLLKSVEMNMSDYRIISGSEIVLEIEAGRKNEAKVAEIEAILDDRHTYNIEVSYSADGYVNAIKLSLYKKR